MPIYEFRCLKCNECFEFLSINQDDQVELRCPECESEDFERVLSVSGHSMACAPTKSDKAKSHTRSCPSGSCTTYNLPGHSR